MGFFSLELLKENHRKIISGPIGILGRRAGWALSFVGAANAVGPDFKPEYFYRDLVAMPIGLGVALFFGSRRGGNGALSGAFLGAGLEFLSSSDERLHGVGAGLLVLAAIKDIAMPVIRRVSTRPSVH